jgi:hypothetical protein
LQCISAPDQGAAFLIQIPIEQQTSSGWALEECKKSPLSPKLRA